MDRPIIVKCRALGAYWQAEEAHREDLWRVVPVKQDGGEWVPRYANPEWNSAGYMRKDKCDVIGEEHAALD